MLILHFAKAFCMFRWYKIKYPFKVIWSEVNTWHYCLMVHLFFCNVFKNFLYKMTSKNKVINSYFHNISMSIYQAGLSSTLSQCSPFKTSLLTDAPTSTAFFAAPSNQLLWWFAGFRQGGPCWCPVFSISLPPVFRRWQIESSLSSIPPEVHSLIYLALCVAQGPLVLVE